MPMTCIRALEMIGVRHITTMKREAVKAQHTRSSSSPACWTTCLCKAAIELSTAGHPDHWQGVSRRQVYDSFATGVGSTSAHHRSNVSECFPYETVGGNRQTLPSSSGLSSSTVIHIYREHVDVVISTQGRTIPSCQLVVR